MASFMNIEPVHRRLELGNIWYVPMAQKTAANTETIYLMLSKSFDELRYRRVQWKCDALNARSAPRHFYAIGVQFSRGYFDNT